MNILVKVFENCVLNEQELLDSLIKLSDNNEESLFLTINEGADLTKVFLLGKNFIEFLQNITDNLRINKERIKIISYNLIQDTSVWADIKIIHPVKYFVDAKNFEIICKKNIKKHFGIFVGGSRWSRLLIASTVFARYKDKLLISYWQHHFNKSQKANLYLDELFMQLHDNENLSLIYDDVINFLKHLPLHLKNEDIKDNKNIGYINWDRAFEILPRYNEIFLDVVCETWHEGQCFLPTEKIARSLISKTPFIVYGSKNFLKNLKKLGFKTFDKWWLEDYDKLDGVQRIQNMLKVIDIISKKSIDELNQMYVGMTEILEHNYNTIKSIDSNKMLELLK